MTCIVPLYAAQRQLLHSEGFTEVRYLEYPGDSQSWPPDVLLSGEADISLSFPPNDLIRIDTGAPVVILAGSLIGCVELVGGDRVRTTPD